ncbi:Uncharacterised protein [Mycobacteroides abscessus subsp. massiliense]|nr:Uncharacterised protein [Mycobacteroides abscessus subsp. massiliense]
MSGHCQLCRFDLHFLVQHREVGFPYFVGPQQGVDDHHLAFAEVLDPQRRKPGLVAQRKMHDRHPVGLRECLCQQHIRFRGLAVRFQVVALVVHQRVELGGGDELQHLDLAAGFGGQARQILIGDDDRAAVFGLVGLVDVPELHDLAAFLAGAFVANPAVVLVVDLMELEVVVLGRAVYLDRDVHQPEGEGALPDGTHIPSMAHRSRGVGDIRPGGNRVRPAVQRRESAVPGHGYQPGHHQSGCLRLLHRDRPLHVAAYRGPAGHPQAVAQRR